MPRPKNSRSMLDKYPQQISFILTEGSANTYTELEIQTPIVRLGDALTIMEIVQIYHSMSMPDLEVPQSNSTQWHIADRTRTTIGDLNDTDVLFADSKKMQTIQDTAVGNTVIFDQSAAKVVQMAGNDGYGTLYPRSSIFVGIKGVGNANAKTVVGKIVYRLVKVNAKELLGLFES